MNSRHNFSSVSAEYVYLHLLLTQKGLSDDSSWRALETYEMERRLSDDNEHYLLVDYGYENIATDIFNKNPIGEQWRQYEKNLFNIKQIALSRSRYHILAQAYNQRQTRNTETDNDPYYIDTTESED